MPLKNMSNRANVKCYASMVFPQIQGFPYKFNYWYKKINLVVDTAKSRGFILDFRTVSGLVRTYFFLIWVMKNVLLNQQKTGIQKLCKLKKINIIFFLIFYVSITMANANFWQMN